MSSVITKKIDKSLAALTVALEDREDFFFTTSFGYQSALIIYLLCSVKLSPPGLYVKSSLAGGGVVNHKTTLTEKFSIDLTEVDRESWLDMQLGSRQFDELHDLEKRIICRDLKKPLLKEYIKEFEKSLWISGVRRDQTESRGGTKFLMASDLGVTKISPLYDWSGAQVYQALKLLNLPINESYEDLCKRNSTGECGLHV